MEAEFSSGNIYCVLGFSNPKKINNRYWSRPFKLYETMDRIMQKVSNYSSDQMIHINVKFTGR